MKDEGLKDEGGKGSKDTMRGARDPRDRGGRTRRREKEDGAAERYLSEGKRLSRVSKRSATPTIKHTSAGVIACVALNGLLRARGRAHLQAKAGEGTGRANRMEKGDDN